MAQPQISDKRILDLKSTAKAAWRNKFGREKRDAIWQERLDLKHSLEKSGVPRPIAETKSWLTMFGKYPFIDALRPTWHAAQIAILREIMAGTINDIPDIAEIPRVPIKEAKLVVTDPDAPPQVQEQDAAAAMAPQARYVVQGGEDDTVLYRDILWVYGHMGDANCTEKDAPNPGSWALLAWAKDGNEKEFFKTMLPKAVTPRKPVEDRKVELLEMHPDVQKLLDWIDKTAVMRGWTSIRKRLEETAPVLST